MSDDLEQHEVDGLERRLDRLYELAVATSGKLPSDVRKLYDAAKSAPPGGKRSAITASAVAISAVMSPLSLYNVPMRDDFFEVYQTRLRSIAISTTVALIIFGFLFSLLCHLSVNQDNLGGLLPLQPASWLVGFLLCGTLGLAGAVLVQFQSLWGSPSRGTTSYYNVSRSYARLFAGTLLGVVMALLSLSGLTQLFKTEFGFGEELLDPAAVYGAALLPLASGLFSDLALTLLAQAARLQDWLKTLLG